MQWIVHAGCTDKLSGTDKADYKVKKWFFGYYHDNKNVNTEEILLYEQMIRIS